MEQPELAMTANASTHVLTDEAEFERKLLVGDLIEATERLEAGGELIDDPQRGDGFGLPLRGCVVLPFRCRRAGGWFRGRSLRPGVRGSRLLSGSG
jgi:hypothetical protein